MGPNESPEAHAGTDFSTRTDKIILLDGSGSTDPDQDDLTYLWTILEKPKLSVLVNQDIENSTGNQPTVVLDASGDCTFGFTVSDSMDLSHDEVVVTAVELGIYEMCTDMWGWDDQNQKVIEEGIEWRGVCSDGMYDIDYWDQVNNFWGRYFYDIIPPSILLSNQGCMDLYANIFEELIVDLGFDGIDINDNFQFLNHWDPAAGRTVWPSYDFTTMAKFVAETHTELPDVDLASRDVYDPVEAAAYIEGNPSVRATFFAWRADQVTRLLRAFQDMVDEIDPDIPVRPHLMPGATSRDDWGYDREGIADAVDVCFLMLGESRESIETAVGWYVDAGAKHIDAGAHSITLYNFGHIYANGLWDLIKEAWIVVWDEMPEPTDA